MFITRLSSALLLLAGGAAAGYALNAYGPDVHRTASSAAPLHEEAAAPAPARETEGGAAEGDILYWYDPMYPNARFDAPGRSPFMDMDLVPRYANDDEGAGIRINPAQVQNLAVHTVRAEVGKLMFSRDVPASVAFNDYQRAKVQPRAEGFVERIYPLTVGDRVTEGTPLAEITVPGWASDQSEYLLLKTQRAGAQIVRGVRERMRLSGMPEELLQALDSTHRIQTRLTIRAPIDGVITAFDVYPGMNVDKTMTVAVIQGTDPVWITADIPERDVHLVAEDSRIRISVPAYPNKAFFAETYTLLPKAEPETRTVSLRASLPNADTLLRPGMTASVRLRGRSEEAVLIPTQSLIDLGDEQRVIVRATDGSFVPRQVKVLRSAREKTSLSEGVEAGEEVVASGLFLIDSEANLRGALERMRRDRDHSSASSHNHREGTRTPLERANGEPS